MDILKETSGSHMAMHLLKWNKKKLVLEHKDAVDLTTEMQLLRVSKELQALIEMGGVQVSLFASFSFFLLDLLF